MARPMTSLYQPKIVMAQPSQAETPQQPPPAFTESTNPTLTASIKFPRNSTKEPTSQKPLKTLQVEFRAVAQLPPSIRGSPLATLNP